MAELLKVEGLKSGYGEAVVVQGVDLRMDEGESLALLGRNGTGKTTLLNTLVGVTRRHAGRIWLAGREITNLPAHRRAEAGIGWVPQERNIFKSLTASCCCSTSRWRAWRPSSWRSCCAPSRVWCARRGCRPSSSSRTRA